MVIIFPNNTLLNQQYCFKCYKPSKPLHLNLPQKSKLYKIIGLWMFGLSLSLSTHHSQNKTMVKLMFLRKVLLKHNSNLCLNMRIHLIYISHQIFVETVFPFSLTNPHLSPNLSTTIENYVQTCSAIPSILWKSIMHSIIILTTHNFAPWIFFLQYHPIKSTYLILTHKKYPYYLSWYSTFKWIVDVGH